MVRGFLFSILHPLSFILSGPRNAALIPTLPRRTIRRPFNSRSNDMARLVRHDATGPIEVKQAGGESLWICACGLSQDLPFCDGSHDNTGAEESGKCYVYDKGRRTVVEVRSDE
jgi:CDGSH-type Zn-finger protein